MPTEKRHMYETGTVNVETGNVATKQDINYYNANPQSATRSIIRAMEDMDKRFSQNQIYDGLTVSNGGSTVDVASGTVKIGGRWLTIDADNISAAVSDGDYNVILEVTGVSETNTRDPSGGEAVTLTLELSGSWSASDLKLVIGGANITSSTVNSVVDRAKRQINATIIKPYGNATQVSIYTGDEPLYREAIRFTSNKIYPYNSIESAFDISGSAISAASYQVGSEILDITEFQHLVGLDQPLDTTQNVSFVQITSTQTSPTPPLVVASTGTVVNLSADYLDGQHAPNGDIVGTSDLQTLNNKTLLTPTIVSFISGSHSHQNAAGGGIVDINVATSGTLLVGQGGTGYASITDGAHILGNGANALEITARPNTGQLLIGQPSGSPQLDVIRIVQVDGDVDFSTSTMGNDGDFNLTLNVDRAVYYTKIDVNKFVMNGADNNRSIVCPFGGSTSASEYEFNSGLYEILNTDSVYYSMLFMIPYPVTIDGSALGIYINTIKIMLQGAPDTNNLIDYVQLYYLSDLGNKYNLQSSPVTWDSIGLKSLTINKTVVASNLGLWLSIRYKTNGASNLQFSPVVANFHYI